MKAITYATAQKGYEALQETAHLLRSPANARRLLGAIRDLSERKGKMIKALRSRKPPWRNFPR
jgi:PHD/YefM family antitoxin component YafN of YafNO toxin-antitoxin module